MPYVLRRVAAPFRHTTRRVAAPFRLVTVMIISCLCAAVLLTAGCETIPSSVNEDISAAELFRLAQDAYNTAYYQTALFYYDTIIERFGDQRSLRVAAEYEIGYINFHQGKHEAAQNMFAQLLAEYRVNSNDFPRWVYVLSRKLHNQLSDPNLHSESQ